MSWRGCDDPRTWAVSRKRGGRGPHGVAVLHLVESAEGADDDLGVGLETCENLDPALVADAGLDGLGVGDATRVHEDNLDVAGLGLGRLLARRAGVPLRPRTDLG